MLWSIIKIAVFVALVAGASFAAIYLLELEGGVRIVMAGQEFNLTPLTAVIALILLMLAIWLLLKLASLLIAVLRFINGDETAISRYFDRNRQEKGYRALSEGLMALASGEGNVAMAKANRAERYLRKPALTNLITAQAAEMAGDRRKAEEVYKRLLANEKTRFVGVRGIMRQKLSDGDTDTALKLAQTAFALKPRHEEVQDTLLKLQAQKHDWSGARDTLRAKLKYGSLPRDVHKRRDAVLALSEAQDILDEGKDIDAKEQAIEANRLSPDLIPAAVMAARSYIRADSKRYASRVIRKAWEAQPHPDLAAAFAEIEPGETPQDRLKRFAKLLKINPEHRETRLVEAELHIAAEDFPAARRALGTLAEDDPDARTLTLMAAIERGEGSSDAVVKGWLTRALAAPRGPQWVCDNCHHIHAQWVPACENCQSFDTLTWRSPPAATVSSSTGVEMLPLIVGSLDDRSREGTDPAPPDATGTPSDTEIADAEIVEDPTPEEDRKAAN
ncbi:heme biosynthesis HemY N-terminal domain-containing protein [Roseovarius sp.]|uniref:heme biosynthesis protein HemY n=1 Tax=Roseovarius sp. TaxID=1486281 RepID=UPI00262CCDAE|nr:heme biosynthesis HemY N-terminal domain-containing protein [Roseovarius sp.]MDM8164983.1 heme biosynthesis HemY N-terminal domain-containing protein [Roseovarius sp.]